MNVADIMKPETKQILSNCVNEYQVLQNLIRVCSNNLEALSDVALKELGVTKEQYKLEMNPINNTWILRPRIQPVPETKNEVVTTQTNEVK